MPMRSELSGPRAERRSVRLDNRDFLLIAAFCVFGLTASIFLAVASWSTEPANFLTALQAFG